MFSALPFRNLPVDQNYTNEHRNFGSIFLFFFALPMSNVSWGSIKWTTRTPKLEIQSRRHGTGHCHKTFVGMDEISATNPAIFPRFLQPILKMHRDRGCFCSPQSIYLSLGKKRWSFFWIFSVLQKSSLAGRSRPIHTLTWAEPMKILAPKHLPQLFVQCIGPQPKKENLVYHNICINLFFPMKRFSTPNV